MKNKYSILYFLMCVYIVIMPLIQEGTNFRGIPVSDILLGIVIFVYLIKIISEKATRERFLYGIKDLFSSVLSISIMVLLGIMLLSTLYAAEKTLALTESARFLTYVFIFFVIKYEFNTVKLVKNLLKCYIFTAGLLSIFGIIQHFTTIGLDKKFVVHYTGYSVVKIAATMFNPNAYAAFLILIIFPVVMLTIYEKNKKNKGMYGIISVLLFVNIIMTYSRNAQIGVCIGAVVLCVIYSYKLIIAFGGIGIFTLFMPSVLDRVRDLPNTAENESRIKLWKTAIMMIKDHPILGVGNGNFISRYNEYVSKYKGLSYNAYKRYPAHNSYLKVESELGIVGIVSFLAVLVTSLIRVKKLFTITNDKFIKAFYMGAFASMIAFFFMNISDNLFFVPMATTYFWFLIATAESLLNSSEIN
ncbi:O-antigen ligase family protein [Clostridium estertheticum]|uniref:O-antigen ligase family protein n=1 Tax=Clostridium estertheticum TaxID=238834 RepID=UPI001C7DC26B|nr:O-antigen ligase family protein [Clostridium estertheticum]MBX4265976.1 O-antigen ligase family protein [Clostridium estertheticum]MBX4268713.1 O-antigen ligase family protein [Clostridium estertheticum]WLC79086.1 O-antigen ligase family protein [Clostridium estertheticum]WLC90105.1 O-antigen ligase family protein [Clostridium estertheticum]